jgi:two-component system chemotaxis response regulator CheB
MIRVLVVDDSKVMQDYVIFILSSDPEIEIIGVANDGEEALAAVLRLKPDVITMDIHMPKMDGFEASRRITEIRPTPIVIVSSSVSIHESAYAFHALEAGALTMVPRPPGPDDPNAESLYRELITTVKLMSQVKVITRSKIKEPRQLAGIDTIPSQDMFKLIAIAGSTGAPIVLRDILMGLPRSLPVPLIIVQHMADGFIAGMATWLSQATGFTTRVAVHGESIQPGVAYLAPDRFNMGVDNSAKVVLTDSDYEHGARPSASYLFRSVAQVFGKSAIAVLLSGMGKDGAAELKKLKDCGAMTIAQDEKSSVVWGMPGEAVRIGGVRKILPDSQIAPALINLLCFDSHKGNLK